MPFSFRVKVCGVTLPEQIAEIAAAGVDAIGLNFVAASRRFLTDTAATELARATPPGVLRFGLFVDAPRQRIATMAEKCPLDAIQLHGDEPPELLADLPPLPVMRAFRISLASGVPQQHTLAGLLAYLQRCETLNCLPRWVLIDAFDPQAHGGTGRTGDWAAAAEYPTHAGAPPLVLAGGLTAENVAQAIARVRPAAVDVSSGVESSPGVKDLARVRAFAAAALAALA